MKKVTLDPKKKGAKKKKAVKPSTILDDQQPRPIDKYCSRRIGCWCEWCSVWGYPDK